MKNKLIILFYCCCISLTCHAAIWKTEEAYIIDDLPDQESDLIGDPDSSNVCFDSSGTQGRCVPNEDCNGHYKFFESLNSNPGELVQNGLEQYLNGTDLEPCSPATFADGLTTTTAYYVCCTSLKYRNVPSITLDEYKSADDSPQFPENEETKILPANVSDVSLGKIVSGQEARVGEFPFAVAIIFRGQQMCGGSLIDSQWILSAAHCFDKFNSAAVRQLVIKVGDHNIATSSDARHQDHLVAKLFLHPGFFRDRGYFKDDLALIKLKNPVTNSGNVGYVTLHNGNPSLNGPLVEAVVCGWGKTCNQCPQSQVLRKTKVPLISNQQCASRYAGTQAPPITGKMICAGGNSGMDACNGDSGGPLVINSGQQTQQIGIVSWGIGCGQYPGVYTRVSSFTSWIAKHKLKP